MKTVFLTHEDEGGIRKMLIAPGDGEEAFRKIHAMLVENNMGFSDDYADFADDIERGNLDLYTVDRTLGWATPAKDFKPVIIENSWDKYSPAAFIRGKVTAEETAEGHDECMSDPDVAAYASSMTIEEFNAIENPVFILTGSGNMTKFEIEEHDNYYLIKPDWASGD